MKASARRARPNEIFGLEIDWCIIIACDVVES